MVLASRCLCAEFCKRESILHIAARTSLEQNEIHSERFQNVF
jgi:hypothetical protein